MNGINALIEGIPHPFHHVRIQQKATIYETESEFSLDTQSASALILDYPDSKSVRNTFLLSIIHLVCGIVL